MPKGIPIGADVAYLEKELAKLRQQAFEVHKANVKKGQVVTRDMCECGMGTGTGATVACRLLSVAQSALDKAKHFEEEANDLAKGMAFVADACGNPCAEIPADAGFSETFGKVYADLIKSWRPWK